MAEETLPSWAKDATRVADLFAQLMAVTMSERLLMETPEANDIGMTVPQFFALRYLWLHHHVLIGELADGLNISYPSATNMVKRLSEKGLTQRAINPDDRREVEVMLTDGGRDLIAFLEKERDTRLRHVLDQMDGDARESLLNGLRQFIVLAVGEGSGVAKEICLRCGWHASDTCPIAEIIPLFPCK